MSNKEPIRRPTAFPLNVRMVIRSPMTPESARENIRTIKLGEVEVRRDKQKKIK